jgi:hypothetical protein
MLGDGQLHLSGIALLAPHLTLGNRDVLLRRATHRSKRQIEELVAEVAPRADVPALVRKVPERRIPSATALTTASMAAAASVTSAPTPTTPAPTATPDAPTPSGMGRTVTPSLRDIPGPALDGERPHFGVRPFAPAPSAVEPLAPGRYKVQFTASTALRDKLERLRALMRSRIPDGDLGAVIEAAVTEKLERLEARRFAAASRPRESLSQTDTAPASIARSSAASDASTGCTLQPVREDAVLPHCLGGEDLGQRRVRLDVLLHVLDDAANRGLRPAHGRRVHRRHVRPRRPLARHTGRVVDRRSRFRCRRRHVAHPFPRPARLHPCSRTSVSPGHLSDVQRACPPSDAAHTSRRKWNRCGTASTDSERTRVGLTGERGPPRPAPAATRIVADDSVCQ